MAPMAVLELDQELAREHRIVDQHQLQLSCARARIDREAESERCATERTARDRRDRTAVLVRDLVRDREPESGAPLSAHARFEDSIFELRIDAGAAVRDRQLARLIVASE